ncbi:glyoxal reductase [Bacillus sp. FJAT-27231]|uniref:aldo/keto reductase n=1 Tax=Bacillus sp. FJAT-27231 TaxID=1679168 RepID=UPI00067175BB|nr:aldo/keto reductase [Bacillus sp. FJAT-27231]KMY53135.1 glyoxal reductase [Bacillus sp. FJAT-27231]
MKVAANLQDTLTLNNGLAIPQVGLGVYKMTDEIEANFAIQSALRMGYRLIDTAAIYENEQIVGDAVRASDVSRDEIFLTTKVWNSDQGYDQTMKAFETSLNKLQTNYIDLYLIHWPGKDKNKYRETWRALEKLYSEGAAKAIGVCNFQIHHLEELLAVCNEVPAINQIENHPYLTQEKLRAYCQEKNIVVEAWSPIARNKLASEPTLNHLAKKYNKSVTQVILRWHLQNGTVVIPKSVHPERIKENSELFDFELSLEDMKNINALNKEERFGPDPDQFENGF